MTIKFYHKNNPEFPGHKAHYHFSNTSDDEVTVYGLRSDTPSHTVHKSEAIFQAMKNPGSDTAHNALTNHSNGGKALQGLGKTPELQNKIFWSDPSKRKAFESIDNPKIRIMEEILLMKVTQNPEILKALLASGDQIIIEDTANSGFTPKNLDCFWGNAQIHDKTGKIIPPAKAGPSHLGKCWMRVRETLREELDEHGQIRVREGFSEELVEELQALDADKYANVQAHQSDKFIDKNGAKIEEKAKKKKKREEKGAKPIPNAKTKKQKLHNIKLHIHKRFSELAKLLDSDEDIRVVIAGGGGSHNLGVGLAVGQWGAKELSDDTIETISKEVAVLRKKYKNRVSFGSIGNKVQGKNKLGPKCIHVWGANAGNWNCDPNDANDKIEGGNQAKAISGRQKTGKFGIITTPMGYDGTQDLLAPDKTYAALRSNELSPDELGPAPTKLPPDPFGRSHPKKKPKWTPGAGSVPEHSVPDFDGVDSDSKSPVVILEEEDELEIDGDEKEESLGKKKKRLKFGETKLQKAKEEAADLENKSGEMGLLEKRRRRRERGAINWTEYEDTGSFIGENGEEVNNYGAQISAQIRDSKDNKNKNTDREWDSDTGEDNPFGRVRIARGKHAGYKPGKGNDKHQFAFIEFTTTDKTVNLTAAISIHDSHGHKISFENDSDEVIRIKYEIVPPSTDLQIYVVRTTFGKDVNGKKTAKDIKLTQAELDGLSPYKKKAIRGMQISGELDGKPFSPDLHKSLIDSIDRGGKTQEQTNNQQELQARYAALESITNYNNRITRKVDYHHTRNDGAFRKKEELELQTAQMLGLKPEAGKNPYVSLLEQYNKGYDRFGNREEETPETTVKLGNRDVAIREAVKNHLYATKTEKANKDFQKAKKQFKKEYLEAIKIEVAAKKEYLKPLRKKLSDKGHEIVLALQEARKESKGQPISAANQRKVLELRKEQAALKEEMDSARFMLGSSYKSDFLHTRRLKERDEKGREESIDTEELSKREIQEIILGKIATNENLSSFTKKIAQQDLEAIGEEEVNEPKEEISPPEIDVLTIERQERYMQMEYMMLSKFDNLPTSKTLPDGEKNEDRDLNIFLKEAADKEKAKMRKKMRELHFDIPKAAGYGEEFFTENENIQILHEFIAKKEKLENRIIHVALSKIALGDIGAWNTAKIVMQDKSINRIFEVAHQEAKQTDLGAISLVDRAQMMLGKSTEHEFASKKEINAIERYCARLVPELRIEVRNLNANKHKLAQVANSMFLADEDFIEEIMDEDAELTTITGSRDVSQEPKEVQEKEALNFMRAQYLALKKLTIKQLALKKFLELKNIDKTKLSKDEESFKKDLLYQARKELDKIKKEFNSITIPHAIKIELEKEFEKNDFITNENNTAQLTSDYQSYKDTLVRNVMINGLHSMEIAMRGNLSERLFDKLDLILIAQDQLLRNKDEYVEKLISHTVPPEIDSKAPSEAQAIANASLEYMREKCTNLRDLHAQRLALEEIMAISKGVKRGVRFRKRTDAVLNRAAKKALSNKDAQVAITIFPQVELELTAINRQIDKLQIPLDIREAVIEEFDKDKIKFRKENAALFEESVDNIRNTVVMDSSGYVISEVNNVLDFASKQAVERNKFANNKAEYVQSLAGLVDADEVDADEVDADEVDADEVDADEVDVDEKDMSPSQYMKNRTIVLKNLFAQRLILEDLAKLGDADEIDLDEIDLKALLGKDATSTEQEETIIIAKGAAKYAKKELKKLNKKITTFSMNPEIRDGLIAELEENSSQFREVDSELMDKAYNTIKGNYCLAMYDKLGHEVADETTAILDLARTLINTKKEFSKGKDRYMKQMMEEENEVEANDEKEEEKEEEKDPDELENSLESLKTLYAQRLALEELASSSRFGFDNSTDQDVAKRITQHANEELARIDEEIGALKPPAIIKEVVESLNENKDEFKKKNPKLMDKQYKKVSVIVQRKTSASFDDIVIDNIEAVFNLAKAAPVILQQNAQDIIERFGDEDRDEVSTTPEDIALDILAAKYGAYTELQSKIEGWQEVLEGLNPFSEDVAKKSLIKLFKGEITKLKEQMKNIKTTPDLLEAINEYDGDSIVPTEKEIQQCLAKEKSPKSAKLLAKKLLESLEEEKDADLSAPKTKSSVAEEIIKSRIDGVVDHKHGGVTTGGRGG